MAEAYYAEFDVPGVLEALLEQFDAPRRSPAGRSEPLAVARLNLDDAPRGASRTLLKALAAGEVVLLARNDAQLERVLERLRPQESAQASETPEPTSIEPVPKLTGRELEALTLAAKGFSAREVASMLGMSVHTVHSHFKNAYRKLGVRSRAEAVFEASRLGLIAL